MRGFQRTLMVRGCSGSSSYSIQAGVSFCVCVCICVYICVCGCEGEAGKKSLQAFIILLLLYNTTVVSRAGAHGRSYFNVDFHRTGRLPGVLGAYRV